MEPKNVGYYFAKTISYLFHPLIIPTLSLWFLFNASPYIDFVITPQLQWALYVVVFIATFIFPVLTSVLLLFLGKIKSLEMESPEERRLPFLLTSLYYTAGYYLLITKIPLPIQVNLLLLGANSAVLITMLINLKWKISAHAIGIGGLIGALLGLSIHLQLNMLIQIAIALLLAGFIGYARLRLNAHTSAQVYIGYAVGFLCQVILFCF